MPVYSLAPSTLLIAACCRRADDPARAALVDHYVGLIEDWDGFLVDVGRHRVNGQILDSLSTVSGVPGFVIAVLEDRARLRRIRGLQQLAELLRLVDLLQSVGIAAAEIKGMTLGVLAYGGTFIKESADLDIFVSRQDAPEAIRLLLSNGYSHDVAGTEISQRQITALVRNRKDLSLSGPCKVKVELHWRLSNAEGLLCGAGSGMTWQRVDVGSGRTVPTLAMSDLVAYLAVHGSLHDWARIKWLADFDALVRLTSEAKREEWLQHANKLGAGGCLQYALAMSSETFGPFPDIADRDRGYTPVTCSLLPLGLRSIEAPFPPPRIELPQRLSLLGKEIRAKLPLHRRIWDIRGLFRGYFFVEKDILRFPLSNHLRYLYPALRGISWASEKLHDLR